ncbi:hypothetical protein LXA43DRAFT_1176588 [Ganoderma leucocontextum]|nr:hypothetical protein LXA43DRAFT_1176588 [Ganoderma leucocontextum]
MSSAAKDKTTAERKTESGTAPSQDNQQPVYSILPHPAKTNDPYDLAPPQLGGGLSSVPEYAAFQAHGPYIPPPNILDNLPLPESKEKLQARQEELNRK